MWASREGRWSKSNTPHYKTPTNSSSASELIMNKEVEISIYTTTCLSYLHVNYLMKKREKRKKVIFGFKIVQYFDFSNIIMAKRFSPGASWPHTG